MIKYLALNNYGSVLDAKLYFTFGESKAPRGYKDSQLLPFINIGNTRVVPSLALIGPNASGKTTLIRSFHTLKNFILRGRNPYNPYRLRVPSLPTTKIEVAWFEKGIEAEYKYSVEANENGIIYESLQYGLDILFKSQNGQLSFPALHISERDSKKVLDTYDLICVDANKRAQVKSVLAFLVKEWPGLDFRINKAYEFWKDRVFFYGLDRNEPIFTPNVLTDGIDLLAKTFTDADPAKRDDLAWQLLSKYMKKLDFSIQRVSCERTKFKSDQFPFPDQLKNLFEDQGLFVNTIKTYHLSETGESVPFDFSWESNGTKQLMSILSYLLTTIRTGGVAIVDEIEESMHTLLVQELIKLFNDKDLNTSKSQIIFTTHNTDLLSDSSLRRSQIAVVSQRGFTGTHVRRLVDIQGVRQSDDFRQDYLNGYYDALPAAYL